MTLRWPSLRSSCTLALALLPLALASSPTGAQVVTPANPQGWYRETRGSAGSASITGANPRQGLAGYDSPLRPTLNTPATGSLALATTGAMGDWGFFRNSSTASATGFGALAALSTLSFDWWRSDIGLLADLGAPWQQQSPVLRIVYGEMVGGTLVDVGELVWERYYQLDDAALAAGMPLDSWQTEDLLGQKFWRHQFDGSSYFVGSGATCSPEQQYEFGSQPVLARPLTSWLDCAFRDPAAVFVTGIAVGVGSQWPGPYQGYVDNVVLGFGGASPVLAANFELDPRVVPEPGSLLLLGAGLAAFGALLRRRPSR